MKKSDSENKPDIKNVLEQSLNAIGYTIEEELGHGQQGAVFKIKNKIGKNFALKIYDPTDNHSDISNFKREVNILSSLYHKNIVNIYTGGTITKHKNKFIIKEGFDENGNLNGYYYYIMDYIEGESLNSIFSEDINHDVKLFEDFITQVTEGMNYYHSKGITHKDIKPDNIRFSSEDSTFIIVDFGFARHLTSYEKASQAISPIALNKTYVDLPSIKNNDYLKNDIAQFALMLIDLLPKFIKYYEENRYKGLKEAISIAIDPDISKRYNTITEFYNSLQKYFKKTDWKFTNKLDEFSIPLRIPVSKTVLLSEKIKRLIDTADFQRLRGVSQLGPISFVFPGANQTRFEHSIGVYSLAFKYIERLIRDYTFRSLCDSVDDTINLTLLSALLHDIGHYPYSHWIEEINEFSDGKLKLPNHEKRAEDIICGNTEIGNLIQNDWEINPTSISNIIASTCNSGVEQCVNSIIDSVIDIDKIDYLIRDSIHCGVNYGQGIDLDRLFTSLHTNIKTKKIYITNKGFSILTAVLNCRNIMYQEVYWHKTVRSCEAMFKRFFYEYVNQEIESIESINNSFNTIDNIFIDKLYEKTRELEINKLMGTFAFKGRKIYKPAYIFNRSNAKDEPEYIKKFFSELLKIGNYHTLVHKSNSLAEKLKKYIPDIKPLDILLEVTPLKSDHEFYKLQNFEIWNIRKNRYESPPQEITYLNNYLKENRQAFLFCNPIYYSSILNLIVNGNIGDILANLK